MKFGIIFANTGPFADPRYAAQLGPAVEAAGIESVWTVEHVIWPARYDSVYPYHPSGRLPGAEEMDMPDPLIWLAYVAATTTTLRLGTGILLLPERNPLIVSKELATLDKLSGGRLELGIGVGWLEEEFNALGIPFARRGARTDEYVEVLRALWSGESTDFSGEFTEFSGVISRPTPTQNPLPITVGGHSEAAARRAGRLGAGFFPGRGSLEEISHLYQVARATAADNGIDPDAIELTAGHPEGIWKEPGRKIDEMRAIGAGRIIFPAYNLLRPDFETALASFEADVLAAV